ncbi:MULTISPECIES: phage terminase large subunit [Rhodobacterales]|uniref:phage terminase large subunit n=1 Tax=Rhodobacterales TaxID=204455 RepID=UPI003299D06B
MQSWDTGTSADPRSDYSACTTWGFRDRSWYLLDVWRGQLDYPDLKSKVLRLVEVWNPIRVLIEDAATGRPLMHELFRNDTRYQKITAKDDKEIRFQSACTPVEEGRVFLPCEADWLSAFKRELQSFPRGRNDDQVDSFSQFLNWSKGQGFYRSLDRDHPINQEQRAAIERQRVRRN